ncbi:hypothetical protein NDN08_002415 [Rhodosorus marinus]|uniref:Glycerate dehydrogenase n=1 Tax=Rhodosorus marinus TaxID=101924 RepID=A0AAV8UTR0_9RHOD|nr:hypothetical protein NDN08_002415 [Rhodosorus marinus]
MSVEMVRNSDERWVIHNPQGKYRVISTKNLVGNLWLEILQKYECRVEVCTDRGVLSNEEIVGAIGSKCDGVLGQLTEKWDDSLFNVLKRAGGKVFSNVAVGYDNVDVPAATKNGIVVGNTPGVLTEATAEMAVSLVYAAARRVVEADQFMRAGLYKIWLPDLFLGKLLTGKTVGIIGAGRIGSTVGLMLARGNKMNLIYYDKYQNKQFEAKLEAYREYLSHTGESTIEWRRADSMEEVIRDSDVLSLHPNLDKTTFHLMNSERLQMMKKDAMLINCARGPVVDEVALVEHCRENPQFYAGLDVFEDEPLMKPGLKDLPNVVVVPHIASATVWTRRGMSALAAMNVAAVINDLPPWGSPNVLSFVGESVEDVPPAGPSLINAKDLNYTGRSVAKL